MRRLLFAVGDPPTEAETTYWVAEAVRVFLAAYGPEGR
ncbi:TetR/AcrR family transcriptional regulator C-terminal domain-containing protein [Methylobacterium indicum]